MSFVDAQHEISRRDFVKAAGIGAAAIGATVAAGTVTARDANSSSMAFAEESAAQDGDTITVTDMIGREVEIPAHAEHLGTLMGGTFDKVLFLGQEDRVTASMVISDSPWMHKIYPQVADLPITQYMPADGRDPNVEELAAMGIDLVYYWAGLDDVVERMAKVGIPTVVTATSTTDYDDPMEYLDILRDEWDIYLDTLNVDSARQIIDDWYDWTKERFELVYDRTSSIAQEDRPKVYYLRSDETGLQCYVKGSAAKPIIELAGGVLMGGDLESSTKASGFETVTMEQVVEWNPDVIFCGWINDTATITDNPEFSAIQAVKDGRVYLNPTSLSPTGFWAGGPETALEVLYDAKTLWPDLFEDVDLIAEIKDFHAKFRGIELTDEDAQAMLLRQGPAED